MINKLIDTLQKVERMNMMVTIIEGAHAKVVRVYAVKFDGKRYIIHLPGAERLGIPKTDRVSLEEHGDKKFFFVESCCGNVTTFII